MENEYYDEIFSTPFPSEHFDKLFISWNWALWRRLVKFFEDHCVECPQQQLRNIDVHCRINPYAGWCHFHRHQSCDTLRELSGEYNVIASSEKIEFPRYVRELKNSKIMFSPFGFGEICPKDFEAIMNGCLLIKPSVEHLNTYPQTHVAYQTYVPVKWDLSDLKEKVIFYLKNDDEREKIVFQAFKTYAEFFRNNGFLAKMEEILQFLGFSISY